MAVDKLVDSTQLDADLTSVANAIRTKGGTSAQLTFPAGFVDAIDAIETGGGGGGNPCVKKQYVQAEDWLVANGSTGGTAAAIIANYCTQGDGLYAVTCSNNNASTKAFIAMVAAIGQPFDVIASSRSGSSWAVNTKSTAGTKDLFISSGAIINVGFVPMSEVVSS